MPDPPVPRVAARRRFAQRFNAVARALGVSTVSATPNDAALDLLRRRLLRKLHPDKSGGRGDAVALLEEVHAADAEWKESKRTHDRSAPRDRKGMPATRGPRRRNA